MQNFLLRFNFSCNVTSCRLGDFDQIFNNIVYIIKHKLYAFSGSAIPKEKFWVRCPFLHKLQYVSVSPFSQLFISHPLCLSVLSPFSSLFFPPSLSFKTVQAIIAVNIKKRSLCPLYYFIVRHSVRVTLCVMTDISLWRKLLHVAKCILKQTYRH